MVTVVDRRSAFHFDVLAGAIAVQRPAVAEYVEAHASVPALAAFVVREATTMGFADANLVGGVCALLLVPVALLYPRRRPPKPQGVSA